MKKILVILLVLVFSQSVQGFDIGRLIFESAIETDRYQSYDWHFATKENPTISPRGYFIYEINPFVAGTNRQEFDKKIDETKKLMNLIYKRNKLLYTTITIVELYVVYQNNQKSKIYGYSQTWVLSYSWEF